MKKNNLLIAMILFFILVLCSCDNVENDNYNEQTESQDEKQLITNVVTNTDDMIQGEKEEYLFDSEHYISANSYRVALSTLSDNDMQRPEDNKGWLRSLTINYPQIYNMDGYDKEERINNLIFQEAINIKDVFSNGNRDYIEYNIDYKIMEANDDLLSILFTGYINSPQKANDIAYSLTIDLGEECLIDLSEYAIIDDSKFEDLKSKFLQIDNRLDDTNVIEDKIKAYILDYNQNSHLHDFYISNDKIGLIIHTSQAINYFIIEGSMKDIQ